MLADMTIWTPWKYFNAAEKWSEINKQDNEANNKHDQKEREKRGAVRKLPNTENK